MMAKDGAKWERGILIVSPFSFYGEAHSRRHERKSLVYILALERSRICRQVRTSFFAQQHDRI